MLNAGHPRLVVKNRPNVEWLGTRPATQIHSLSHSKLNYSGHAETSFEASGTCAWRIAKLAQNVAIRHRYETMHMIPKGQVRWLAKGDVLGQRAFVHSLFGIATQKAVIDLQGLLRYITAICDRSLWIPVRTEMPARHTPYQLAWGPRSSARPNIHDDRNGTFRAGLARWRSSRLRSSYAWGSCISFFRFSWPVLHSDPTLTLDVIDSRALFLLNRSRPPVLVTRFA